MAGSNPALVIFFFSFCLLFITDAIPTPRYPVKANLPSSVNPIPSHSPYLPRRPVQANKYRQRPVPVPQPELNKDYKLYDSKAATPVKKFKDSKEPISDFREDFKNIDTPDLTAIDKKSSILTDGEENLHQDITEVSPNEMPVADYLDSHEAEPETNEDLTENTPSTADKKTANKFNKENVVDGNHITDIPDIEVEARGGLDPGVIDQNENKNETDEKLNRDDTGNRDTENKDLLNQNNFPNATLFENSDEKYSNQPSKQTDIGNKNNAKDDDSLLIDPTEESQEEQFNPAEEDQNQEDQFSPTEESQEGQFNPTEEDQDQENQFSPTEESQEEQFNPSEEDQNQENQFSPTEESQEEQFNPTEDQNQEDQYNPTEESQEDQFNPTEEDQNPEEQFYPTEEDQDQKEQFNPAEEDQDQENQLNPTEEDQDNHFGLNDENEENHSRNDLGNDDVNGEDYDENFPVFDEDDITTTDEIHNPSDTFNNDDLFHQVLDEVNNTVDKYGTKASLTALLLVFLVLFVIVFVLVRTCKKYNRARRNAREIHRQEKEFLLQNQGNGRYVDDRTYDESTEDEL